MYRNEHITFTYNKRNNILWLLYCYCWWSCCFWCGYAISCFKASWLRKEKRRKKLSYYCYYSLCRCEVCACRWRRIWCVPLKTRTLTQRFQTSELQHYMHNITQSFLNTTYAQADRAILPAVSAFIFCSGERVVKHAVYWSTPFRNFKNFNFLQHLRQRGKQEIARNKLKYHPPYPSNSTNSAPSASSL